ncbi:MAG: AI-2E family transporter [Polymorphobacter sp.]
MQPETSPRVSHAAGIDMALRLTLVAALVYACFRVAAPFFGIMLWGILLAVMIWPLHVRLRRAKGMTNARSATLIGVSGVLLLLVPAVIAVESLGASAFALFEAWRADRLVLLPLPQWLEAMPFLGPRATRVWTLANSNMPELLKEYAPLIKTVAAKLGGFAAGLAGDVFAMIGALVVAAIMLAWGEPGAALIQDIFARVTGDDTRGKRLVTLSAATVRGVLQGVVGVAFVQAVLLGLGFFAVGMPFAGAAAVVALLFGILQVPALLISLPAIGWAFSALPTTTATIFAVWTIVAGLSDNVLKPLMLGRGLEVPMPVMLIGVIGGMLADGLVGLFVGPVLLGVGYVLFLDWLRSGRPLPETDSAKP